MFSNKFTKRGTKRHSIKSKQFPLHVLRSLHYGNEKAQIISGSSSGRAPLYHRELPQRWRQRHSSRASVICAKFVCISYSVELRSGLEEGGESSIALLCLRATRTRTSSLGPTGNPISTSSQQTRDTSFSFEPVADVLPEESC